MRKTKAFKTFLEQSMSDTFVGNDELLWDSRLVVPTPTVQRMTTPWVAMTQRPTPSQSLVLPVEGKMNLMPWQELAVVMYVTHDTSKDIAVVEEWPVGAEMDCSNLSVVHYSVIVSPSTQLSIYRINPSQQTVHSTLGELGYSLYQRIGVLSAEVIQRLMTRKPEYITHNVRFCADSSVETYTLEMLLSTENIKSALFVSNYQQWLRDVQYLIEKQFKLFTR